MVQLITESLMDYSNLEECNAMKYLKTKNYKELKARIIVSLHERLSELSKVRDESINSILNNILFDYLSKELRSEQLTSKQKQNVYIEDGQIKLLHNDFLTVDLSDIVGKVNLIVTSPPYNVGIEYGNTDDKTSYEEYLHFTENYLKRFYEVLADDGRVCLNIPLDKNKGGLKSVYADVLTLAKSVGLKYQSTIVWNEQNISRRTAWGSWLSASAPYVIAPVEMIVLLYKNSWKRKNKGRSTIARGEFIAWTNGMWTFSGESKKRIGHPAPFPVELPLRCIKLFSFEGDLVLDPFVGSGTTMVACKLTDRKGIGIDLDETYLEIAKRRLIEQFPDLFSLLY